jgi:hypothetical protein
MRRIVYLSWSAREIIGSIKMAFHSIASVRAGGTKMDQVPA